jgi:hypothetical protein
MSGRPAVLLRIVLVGAWLLLLHLAPASAAVTYYRWFKTATYEQTSIAQPLAPHYFGAVDVLFSDPLDLTGGTVTSTSSLSPMHLSKSTPTYFNYEMNFTFLAGLDVNFPNSSSYTYNIFGGQLGSQTASLTPPANDLFPAAVPFITGTGYSQIQGMNVGVPLTLTWSGYTPAAGTNTPLIFLSITRVSDGHVQFQTQGDNTLTSALIPANTLAAGTAYDLDLVYDNRIDTSHAGFGGASSEVGFDNRTDITFTTAAVPEPSSVVLVSWAVLVVLSYRCRCFAD